jgi:hypothetical protein
MEGKSMNVPGARALLVTSACLLVSLVSVWAGKHDQSTAEDKAKLVKLTHQLESDPLGEGAAEARQWLIPFINKAKDISVLVCDLLGPITNGEHPYSAEIVTQMIFSNAAFQVEHPDKVDDKVAVQTAGIEGALKAYEAIVKAKPEARFDFLDDLIRKRDSGELIEYMRKTVPSKCS